MYLQHFGLAHAPLGKELAEPWDDGALAQLAQRFDWLLKSPGIGLLTGEPGVGKTAALRKLTRALNPHRYLVLYLAETDFGRVDVYRGLARALGVEPSYRRAQLWRDIKQRVHELADGKQVTPIWIVDEAQNLPLEFFRDFPAFLNFAFDSRDLLSVWLVGHPCLAATLERAPYAALASRIQVHVQLKPVFERERFVQLVAHGRKSAAASTRCWPTRGSRSCARLQGAAAAGQPNPVHRHAAGRAQGTEPPARRTAATSHHGAAMTSTATSSHDSVPLPRLSDKAAVEIYLFIEHMFLLFESHYGPQIRRHFHDLDQHSLFDKDSDSPPDDPPF